MICKLAYIPADCKSYRNVTSRFTLSHSLAAAIVPRRREKSARHQFRPLGEARCVLKPDAGCGEGGLSPVSASRAAVPRPPTYLTAAMPLHGSRCHIASRKAPSIAGCPTRHAAWPRYGRCGRFVSTIHTAPLLIACIACRAGRCFSRGLFSYPAIHIRRRTAP